MALVFSACTEEPILEPLESNPKEKIGLDEEETMGIISQLLSEHGIELEENKACNYSVYDYPLSCT
ncbi:hypothetical protein MM236_02195 [Belliella sp. DSM 107340]|uniref:Uncharacterized protein n=1 Tax=Belliella calami TaxID=2923436 RepID=A0ABS9UKS6_9BACT|nr:hypothetical protein [Belliella calami]MCH7396775.1 hypothetical protein [Belliella calami]